MVSMLFVDWGSLYFLCLVVTDILLYFQPHNMIFVPGLYWKLERDYSIWIKKLNWWLGLRPIFLCLFLPSTWKVFRWSALLIVLTVWFNVVQEWWGGSCCYRTWAWPLEAKPHNVLFHSCSGTMNYFLFYYYYYYFFVYLFSCILYSFSRSYEGLGPWTSWNPQLLSHPQSHAVNLSGFFYSCFWVWEFKLVAGDILSPPWSQT